MALPFFKKIVPENTSEIPNSMWRSVLLLLDDAIFVYDTDFKIVFWNNVAKRLFGIDSAAAMGHVITPKDIESDEWHLLGQAVFPSLAPVMVIRSEPGATPQIIDLSFTEPSKELRTVTAPIIDDEGRQFGFLKIVKDRTEELASVKAKDSFLEIASHQLRGPITNINWALEMLLENQALSEEDKKFVQGALDAGRALFQIANDLLQVSRSEAVGSYRFEETDIISFLNSAMASLLPAAKHAEVNMYLTQPEGPLPKVLVDQEKLNMALANILDNAVRYNVKNGEVTVAVSQDPSAPYIAVSIKDTGIGIAPDEIQKVSGKFYRAENARRYQPNGSGLGLYIAKNIVAGHGGRLTIASEPNRGTEISFTLPTDSQLIPGYKPNVTESSPNAP